MRTCVELCAVVEAVVGYLVAEAVFGMKYYQRPDVTVQLWPPPHQDGLSSHLNCSWKAVGGQPQWAHLPRV